MTRNLTITHSKRALASACLSLLLATLPISSNAQAQNAPATTNATAASPPMTRPTYNYSCTFESPDFGDKACATGETVVLAPFAIALGVPMLVVWGGLALAIEPVVLLAGGGRNPLD